MPAFLPSGQLTGSLCRTQVLVIRDFATTCTCTCRHYYAIFIHSACTHVHAHVCTMRLYTSLAYLSVCGYTRQPAQWHLSSCGYSRQPYPRCFKHMVFISKRVVLNSKNLNFKMLYIGYVSQWETFETMVPDPCVGQYRPGTRNKSYLDSF